jgi:enoyl ACP reductase
MFRVMQTAVKASMAAAWLKLPALSGRRPRIRSMRDSVTTAASGWSEQTSTSASNPDSKFSISDAGRWWKAAATNESGSAACTAAATEPRGGISASISRPSLTSALAMEMTTFPARASRSGLRVAMAFSHGVPRTTSSALAAPKLSAPTISRVRAGHFARTSSAIPSARSASREPKVTCTPDSAKRTATPRPAGPVPPSIPTCTPLLSHTLVVLMGLLDGKRLLITGVLTDASLAFAVAKLAQEEGADIVLSGAGRALSLTRRTARKLPAEPEVLEIDVTSAEQLETAGSALAARWDSLDGILHAIGFAPPNCLGNGMFAANWDEVSIALNVSAYSLKALVEAFRPLLTKAGNNGGASVVGLDFDATVAWPLYDWMGVAKAALESLTRYLAKELGPEGIRVNLVAAGPVRTMAAKSIPGFSAFEDTWAERAPLGWDVHNAEVVARGCIALFSDLLPMTTGEILHVDGGVHAVQ